LGKGKKIGGEKGGDRGQVREDSRKKRPLRRQMRGEKKGHIRKRGDEQPKKKHSFGPAEFKEGTEGNIFSD